MTFPHIYTALIKNFKFFKLNILRIGVVKKVKNFEINPIIKKSYLKKLTGGGVPI